MAIFVLIHGGTGGGWQFREFALRLRRHGHSVYTPTLSGLGERSHLLSRAINLSTHVQDIVNVLLYEDLRDVVLLGKSYGGVPVTAAADRAPERVRHVVYLDALVPHNGQSVLDLHGAEIAARMRQAVDERGDGWRLPGANPADPRFGDQPFATFSEPLTLQNPALNLPRTYIRCTAQPPNAHTRMTAEFAARARTEGWGYYELACDHDAERTMPNELERILLAVA